MSEERQSELLGAIGQKLVDIAPEGWDELRLNVSAQDEAATAFNIDFRSKANGAFGENLRSPIALELALLQEELLQDQGKRTRSITMMIASDGKLTIDFGY